MSSPNNVINQIAFLRTSREFPEEIKQMSVEVNKSYVDIASAVNARTIGLYSTTRPTITGDSWYLSGNLKQQTLREIYTFTATTAINHGIPNLIPGQVIPCYGNYTDGTNSYGLIYGTSVAVAGLITFYVTATQIIFSVGAGAPSLTSGIIVLQWLSSP